MKELEVRQATTAPVSELSEVLGDLRPMPMPSLTLRWRGRAKVRVLDARFSAESAPAPGGGAVLTCRYRFTGPFSWLIGRGEYEWMRGDLQYFAARVCHRAEKRSGSRRSVIRLPSRIRGTVVAEDVICRLTAGADCVRSESPPAGAGRRDDVATTRAG